jgi:hypothetical protein
MSYIGVVAAVAHSTWVTANYLHQVVLVEAAGLVCTTVVQDIQVRQN